LLTTLAKIAASISADRQHELAFGMPAFEFAVRGGYLLAPNAVARPIVAQSHAEAC
jgi:hypothetical protein